MEKIQIRVRLSAEYQKDVDARIEHAQRVIDWQEYVDGTAHLEPAWVAENFRALAEKIGAPFEDCTFGIKMNRPHPQNEKKEIQILKKETGLILSQSHAAILVFVSHCEAAFMSAG